MRWGWCNVKKFNVSGIVGVSCYTIVEAETAEEAKEIAEDRDMANLCHNALSPDCDDSWHLDTDGTPGRLSVTEVET